MSSTNKTEIGLIFGSVGTNLKEKIFVMII